MTLKIYLADLVYDTIRTNFVVPLNIGFIGAHASARFGREVEISLFKYPTELEAALRAGPPHVLAVSNYSWNARLSLAFLDIARDIDPSVLTVMGGPNIRTTATELRAFLGCHQNLDYYVVHEGEEPFSLLIEGLLGQVDLPVEVPGCARLVDEQLSYKPLDFNSKPREMKQPSPYLSGMLDRFIRNPDMTPAFETNRGCPFGCTYCAWGAAALSRVRQRPMEEVLAEIDYLGTHSAGQTDWICCDANFGMLPRDVDIARHIRHTMDTKGFPIQVQLWHSKNTGQRNIDIVKILGNKSQGYVAIQSTDAEVLTNAGRGTIKLSEFKKVIDHYKEQSIPVATDILVGLPGESAKSHLQTLCDAFDLGFDCIQVYNIRMLPGTEYESDEWRSRFGVLTKFRPIYGAYGTYGGRRILEVEESVRGTCAMSEEELNQFKLLHAMIGFAWNSGIFKPLLRYGHLRGINPARVLSELTGSQDPLLRGLFEGLAAESLDEWFDTPEELAAYYEEPKNYAKLTADFMKLYMLFQAKVLGNPEVIRRMLRALCDLLRQKLAVTNGDGDVLIAELAALVEGSFCQDLFGEDQPLRRNCSGSAAAIIFGRAAYEAREEVAIEICRPKEATAFCRSFFAADRERNAALPLQSLVRFIERDGLRAFVRVIRPLDGEARN